MSAEAPLLETTGLTVSYGGLRANDALSRAVPHSSES